MFGITVEVDTNMIFKWLRDGRYTTFSISAVLPASSPHLSFRPRPIEFELRAF